MNDTKLTARQLTILDSLSNTPQTRIQVAEKIKPQYPISKATLMRDLDALTQQGLVKSQGEGKATVYISKTNQLLKPIDLQLYFSDNSPIRKAGPKYFNPAIFNLVNDLFTKEETNEIAQKNITLSLQKKKLDPTIYRREIERFTVEFAWKSSKIEGNTYSLLETEVLIKQMKEAYGRTKYEAIMILNHKRAVDHILEHYQDYKKLTTERIINLHKILTKDLEITAGIRKNKVAITGTDFAPLYGQEALRTALVKAVEIINQAIHPLAKALLVLALVSYIQPFVDGNKRTARTLANAVLIAHDYLPLSYRNLNEVEYLEAVLLFYETNNLYHLKRILLEQYQFASENYFRN